MMVQVIDYQEKGGMVEVQLAEAVVHSLNLKFLDPKTNAPKEGATRPDIVLRHFITQPGRTYSLKQVFGTTSAAPHL
jgi:hypothetical protein